MYFCWWPTWTSGVQRMYNIYAKVDKQLKWEGRDDPAAEQNVQVNSWGEVGKQLEQRSVPAG